ATAATLRAVAPACSLRPGRPARVRAAPSGPAAAGGHVSARSAPGEWAGPRRGSRRPPGLQGPARRVPAPPAPRARVCTRVQPVTRGKRSQREPGCRGLWAAGPLKKPKQPVYSLGNFNNEKRRRSWPLTFPHPSGPSHHAYLRSIIPFFLASSASACAACSPHSSSRGQENPTHRTSLLCLESLKFPPHSEKSPIPPWG
ncbi:PREDICTED: translation initiation factor IF-2-like, partial [Chinchilla lanigera]|uniref:translation initiation factor IF-2-like n=1 Tax=Chinchilla lanigera TaxID=34839 RepID=UPI0006971B07